jgi:type I restriction enzyme M protein
VSTAILFFTKTHSGGTDRVWFYDMRADGWSLDDKRAPLLAENLLGVNPAQALSDAEHARNNLPDVLARWRSRGGAERQRARTEQSFCVPRAEIAGNGYDLSINRYKEVVHEAVAHDPPAAILARLATLELTIQQGMTELETMLQAPAVTSEP